MCLIITSMTSRLDRLFILLETGANAATKRVAAQQLGEAQRLHPHELHHLLSRVSSLLKSTQWDTRIAAAHAVQAIISQVPVWDPQPLEKRLTNEGEETNKQNDHEEEKAKDEEEEFVSQKKITKKLSFDNFNMSQVFTQSLYLTGSEGSEYDHTLMETGTSSIPNEKMLAEKLGLHPHLLGVNTNELFTSDDFIANVPPAVPPIKPEKTIGETLEQNLGISRREMNRARRKARQSSSKQRSRESDDPVDNSSSNLDLVSVENPCKKVKLDSEVQTETSLSIDDYTIDPRCAVPDATGCWPDTAIVWPFEAFAENLLQDLFSLKWEVRHGAATAFRELIRLHGKGAGKSRNHTLEEMKESHRQWLIDAALRLLCILGIDRFGDYISDQVVAPVRETCAQALGSLVTLISSKTKKEIKVEENTSAENSENKSESDESSENYKQDIMGLLSIILKLSKHTEWEARHGALLALKYLLAIRSDLLKDILPVAFPAIMQGLSDFVEDVGAMAASALIPIASDLPKLLNPQQLETIILKLWQLLKEQDDLAAACNSFMGLLAAVLSLPSARAFLTPQPLSTILPRLFPFLSHSSSSVRKSTLETLETLVGDEKDNVTNFEERWGEDDGAILQDTLQHVFQRILIEHIDKIQEIAERVWEKLVVQSDLKLLLVASCPLISTWLCLAMQPEHVPFNIDLFKNMTFQKASKGPSAPAELKIYMGGIETVPRNVRHFNVVRARCTAARMLGLLSVYIVKPMPGVVYSPELPSPSLCYAKVLLAHLHSRSALQRTFAALTMSHWATVDQNKPLEIPDCLRDQLFVCLNECIYYDEIASSVSRLLHESRDYVAMLKHYKLSFPMEINTEGVINLDQIAQLASISTTNLRVINPNDPTDTTSSKTKLKPKIVETLEERRRALEAGALASAAQQQALHITAMAALAGAATMLECLPEPPQPLNPLVKPLMESIKREEDEELQKLSARHLAHLVSLCVNRTPCPNTKIAMNLSIFLCSDSEFTPRIDISNKEDIFYDGIVTLTNRHKQAERSAYNRTNSSGITINRGPGRPPATDIPKEDLLACDEPEAKAARTKRQGATAALTAIVTLLGERLSETLPQLWNTILPENLRNYNAEKFMTVEEANQLICDLQVMEVVMRNLDKSLLLPIMSCLENLCLLLTNAFKYVRHMASRCLAVLVSLKTKETMDVVVEKIIAFLETRNPSDVTSKSVANPNEINASRQGASEALACLVETLGVNIVPYAVRFMVPLLGRMSDQNQAVRLTCSSTFATLVQLLPLDPRALDTSQKIENKDKEHQFLEQLLSPQNIPDTQLTVPVAASLRSYQQQGLNWLNFLNRYQLHGVLCDDMGLGKTLQTLCILALDHDRNKQAPTSLVICPPTLTGHWVYEAEKFFNAKDLSVIQYAGNPTERKKLRSRVLKHKLAVASYYIVRKDIEFFQEIQWNYCVLDEGHIIKNGKTKSAKAVKKLHAHHRLILSGTPVQNNVLELWSLFDFLMPGFLGSEKQFAAKYSRPILACREPKAGPKEQEAGALAMEALHRQALPFLLRRNKEDVLKDLPPKITQDYYCDLSVIQKTLYEDFRTKHSSNILNSATSSGNSHGHVFEALRYLRNVCNHPRLVVTPKHPLCQTIANILAQQNSTLYDIEQAAKLPALKQLLLDCGIGQANNQQYQNSIGSSSVSASSDNQQQQINLVSQHRALIFCQLKAMLDIVEQDLLQKHLQNVTYLRLDGGVPAAQRHSIVTRFNSDPSIDILLLTTQVGGLGLNLTGADTVIFIEHDWNPMKDLQAMDRAHRIGQKKVVNVYRLITRNTLEEKIMGLQKFKLLTANTIISTENNSLNTMKTEQLLDLFSLESTKTRSNSSVVENQNETNFVGLQGVNRSVLEMLPDLWEQQQYDDEYDLDSFLSTLQNTT